MSGLSVLQIQELKIIQSVRWLIRQYPDEVHQEFSASMRPGHGQGSGRAPLDGAGGGPEERHAVHDERVVHVDEERHALLFAQLTQVHLLSDRSVENARRCIEGGFKVVWLS